MEHTLKVLSVEAIGRKAPRPRSRMAITLDNAIAHHEIDVQFQPQFNLRTGRGTGMEALARWRGSDGAETPPSKFIPIAERFGLIGAMGASVLHQACAALANSGVSDIQPMLSVNVSTRQINTDFCAIVANVLDLTKFPGERLALEVTETAMMTDPELAARSLTLCKQLGVRISLDDFGTGYSSLAYLARLPVDQLKLDKSFTDRAASHPKTACIVRSIIRMAEDLGIEVLAEGIETEQQLSAVTSLGCSLGQGNLLAHSLPVDRAWLLMHRSWGDRFPEASSALVDAGGLHAA
jgi:EAL domain-containing protein (putative c-di-GMP-specific phosphodiesterase class I)